VTRQLLGVALGAEKLGQRFRQRGEASDVGEENCTVAAIGQRQTVDQGVESIGGNVGGE